MISNNGCNEAGREKGIGERPCNGKGHTIAGQSQRNITNENSLAEILYNICTFLLLSFDQLQTPWTPAVDRSFHVIFDFHTDRQDDPAYIFDWHSWTEYYQTTHH